MLRLTALITLLLASGAARGQDADLLLRNAFDHLADSAAYAYEFELTMTSADTVERVRGNAITYSDPSLDFGNSFALEFYEEGYRVAFDGEVFEYASERTRKVYADSTRDEGFSDGYMPLLALHPTIVGAFVFVVTEGDGEPSVEEDTVEGCTRVTVSHSGPGGIIGGGSCYDYTTGLPLHIWVEYDEEHRDDLRISGLERIPAPPVEAFRIATPEGWSRTNYSGGDGDALMVGDRAPEFALQTVSGKTVALSDFRGQTVVLDFWGTWCVPCVKALPAMADLASEHADVPILGLASYEDAETDPEAFARAKGVEYPILRADEATLEAYRIYAFPTYIVVGPDGSILFHEVHDAEADTPTEAALSTFLHALTAP